jgi:hypothetical protein
MKDNIISGGNVGNEELCFDNDSLFEAYRFLSRVEMVFNKVLKESLREVFKGYFQRKIEVIPFSFIFVPVDSSDYFKHNISTFRNFHYSVHEMLYYREKFDRVFERMDSKKELRDGSLFRFWHDKVVFPFLVTIPGAPGNYRVSVYGAFKISFSEILEKFDREIEERLMFCGDDEKVGENKIDEHKILEGSFLDVNTLKFDVQVCCDTRDSPSFLRHKLERESFICDMPNHVMDWGVLTLTAYQDELMQFLSGVKRT